MQHRGSPLDGVWELVLCLWLLMGGYVGVCAREALRSRHHNIRYEPAVLNLATAMWTGVSLIFGWLWLAGTHYSRLREYPELSTASSI